MMVLGMKCCILVDVIKTCIQVACMLPRSLWIILERFFVITNAFFSTFGVLVIKMNPRIWMAEPTTTFLSIVSTLIDLHWGPVHCGLHCALGGSLGINITSFPLHCSLWNIQSEKHFSAYFQMLWNYLYPILTHFYWIKSFMSLEYKRREIWENKVKNTAKLSYI